MLAKVRAELQKLQTEINDLDEHGDHDEHGGRSEHERHKVVYVGLYCIDILKQLSAIQETVDELKGGINSIDESRTDEYTVMIRNKEQLMTSENQFIKTFSPYMILYNLGYLHVNHN